MHWRHDDVFDFHRWTRSEVLAQDVRVAPSADGGDPMMGAGRSPLILVCQTFLRKASSSARRCTMVASHEDPLYHRI